MISPCQGGKVINNDNLGGVMRKSVPVLCVVAVFALQGQARAVDKNYDMSIFLNQQHPFLVKSPAPVAAPQPAARPVAKARPTRAVARQAVNAPSEMAMTPANNTITAKPWGGFISEVRIGALAHDVGPFSAKKEDGMDTNLEVLFASPEFLDVIWSPRPQLGINYNTSGDTSQAYMGLEWEYGFWDGWFASFGFGGAVHDGHLVGDKAGKTDRKSLGCRLLFREALNLGYRFGGRHAVMVQLDHISNASLCEKEVDNDATGGRHTVTLNEGLETLGVRYGYLF
ncbi:MAG: acyloxyacyl hydrolase [Rhodospirillales bacterium]|nr:acyloxyacyl hydrolase [Rhodospirillales bacterium]